MDLKSTWMLFAAVVVICSFEWPGTGAVDCEMKEYTKCADLVAGIQANGSCGQIEKVRDCLKALVTACNQTNCSVSYPVYPVPFNTCLSDDNGNLEVIFDDAARPYHTVCKIAANLDSCTAKNCADLNLEDKLRNRRENNNTNDLKKRKCGLDAYKKLKDSGVTNMIVRNDSCLLMGEAIADYEKDWERCQAYPEQVLRRDVMIAGITQFLKECIQAGHKFATDKVPCADDPLDPGLRGSVWDLIQALPSNKTRYCPTVKDLFDKYNKFIKKCPISSIITIKVYSKILKYKEGCPNTGISTVPPNTGISSVTNRMDILTLTSLITLVISRLLK